MDKKNLSIRLANDSIVWYSSQILIFGKSNHPFCQADKTLWMLIVDLRVSSAQIPAYMKCTEVGPIYPLTIGQDSVTKVTQAGRCDADVLVGVMTQFVFSSATLLSDNSNFP